MFGRVMPSEPMPWSWAEERLAGARTYWICTARTGLGPHARPVWGVWLDEAFWFSTASQVRGNLRAESSMTVHLESGEEVVIVEGTAERVTEPGDLGRFVDANNEKYAWNSFVEGDGVSDPDGNAGSVYRLHPRRAFGWTMDLEATATRWSFEEPR